MTNRSLLAAVAVAALATGSTAALGDPPTSERNGSPAGDGSALAPSSGPVAFGPDGAKVYYSDSNSFNPATPFYEYDVATDAWTDRAPLPGTNTTQLASDENGTVFSLPEDGNIYAYDALSDSWAFVMSGPAAAVGRNNISMFEAHGGEFYWARDGTSDFYYTSGGVWNLIAAPRTLSCGAATDRDAGIVYIRTYSELGFSAFDPSGPAFTQTCDHGVGVGENSRVGAYFNGEFYSRTESGTYMAIDVASCAVRDTGTAPNSSHSATGEDTDGNIYSNGWNDDTVFEVYDAVTDNLVPLAPAPDIQDNAHSTLVAVGAPDGCALNLALGQDRLFPGGRLSFTVDVAHRRPLTVTVRLRAWVEDAGGAEVAHLDAGQLTLHYRDRIRVERSLPLPARLAPGAYTLNLAVSRMRQGTVVDQEPFEVVE